MKNKNENYITENNNNNNKFIPTSRTTIYCSHLNGEIRCTEIDNQSYYLQIKVKFYRKIADKFDGA